MPSTAQAFFDRQAQNGKIVVRDPPKFDLESYIANYDGRTRIDRLFTIGTCCPLFSVEALRTAVREAKQGKDVDLYLNLCQALHALAPDDPLAALDTSWAEARTKQMKAEGDRLEAELKGYKNNLIKESIRVSSHPVNCITSAWPPIPRLFYGRKCSYNRIFQMGNEDLGNFAYSTGDFQAAAKAYNRMRDYATLPKHIAEMTLRQTLVALTQRLWMPAASHLAKLRNLHPQLTQADKPKFDHVGYALAGLAEMGTRSFRDAATWFLRVDPQLFGASSDASVAGIAWTRAVLTPNDVAVYGGLSALASMTRTELQAHVLDSPSFRAFLELEPHLRRAIAFFVNAKYAQCLGTLEAYRGDWLLDVYLQPLVAELFAAVRQKCIVQYFEAFSCVELDELARQFPPPAPIITTATPTTTAAATAAPTSATTPSTTTNGTTTTVPSSATALLCAELTALIKAGILHARLDLPNNQLVAPPADTRREVLLSALADAAEMERTLRLRLHRINMVDAGMEVKAALGTDGGAGAGGGDGGGLFAGFRSGKGTRTGRAFG
ncbi:MAG: hypothetical protein M1822_000498 [Bathelium mastoideum]|nr:MAG: hypothetical protein M1822_000498 [Bathelium mastoideum]